MSELDPEAGQPTAGADPGRRRVLRGVAAAALSAAAPPVAAPPVAATRSEGAGASRQASSDTGAYRTSFPERLERVWLGPELWANRLQDWQVSGGRIECRQGAAAWPYRTVHLLTRRLGAPRGELALEVRLGRIESRGTVSTAAAAGFLIGAGGSAAEYRAAALVHHLGGPGAGLLAGVDAAGSVFFHDWEQPRRAARSQSSVEAAALPREIRLRLIGRPAGSGYTLILTAEDPQSGRRLSEATLEGLEAERITGSLALFSHPGEAPDTARFWFRDWQVSGSAVEAHPERAWGPVLSTLYTVHNGVLKLTAQLPPVGELDARTAKLQFKRGNRWRTVATENIVVPGYTVPFRVEKWDASRDVPFRVVYELAEGSGRRPYHWEGTVRRDPIENETLVVASLSCVQQVNGVVGGGMAPRPGATYRWRDRVWFPHHDMVPNLAKQKADLYFFAGDQIYEGNPTRVVRAPAAESELDYLYKWYLWCWSFGDLVRSAPCICIPDDHDVYQGNVWGDSGRPARLDDPGGTQGGYGMPARWLNMMQRTQTSHLPDPHDRTPIRQGIEVYYTSLVWGGIGFAVLEDRKFKSSPSIVQAEKTPDNHIIEKDYDTRKADLPGAQLLGERQQSFLRAFAADWRGQQMKAVLSQTIFCNLQISSRGTTAGELDKDLDSNGWPQRGRAAALREMRRGFMVHLAGDQHLASAIHHGVDEWEDAGWSLCSPAISNLYIRFWNPDYPPETPAPGARPYMGRYRDGFQNRLTVHAVANPVEEPRPGQFPEPVELHRKATGYSIVRFNKQDRTITLEAWPRFVDPAEPRTGGQYPGWPITIRQEDNYGRKPTAWLPALRVNGVRDPVLAVTEDSTGELVYALRIRGSEYRPGVFAPGTYTVVVSHPETGRTRTFKGVAAAPDTASSGVLEVRFR